MKKANNWSDEDIARGLANMRQETAMLKIGNSGKPRFRNFRLDPSFQYITWASKSKDPNDSRVALRLVKEIKFGQHTDKFRKSRRPDLEPRSFSVIYLSEAAAAALAYTGSSGAAATSAGSADLSSFGGGGGGGGSSGGAQLNTDTLDLVCTTEKEFQQWTTCLLALFGNKVSDAVKKRAGKLYDELVASGGSGGGKGGGHARTHSTAFRRPGAPDKGGDGGQPDQHELQGADVYSFGRGNWGQHGTNDPELRNLVQPTIVDALLGHGVQQVSLGWSHSTVLLDTGAVLQYGNRVGTGMRDDFMKPRNVEIDQKDGAVFISSGSFHNLAVTGKGDVLSWGVGLNGELGHGDTNDQPTPKLITWFDLNCRAMIVEVACGEHGSIALSDTGEVFTWGCGESGFLGHNDTENRYEPTPVRDLKGEEIQKIACGSSHMFACSMHETYAWGNNSCGQLGLGHDKDQLRPHVVDALRGKEVVDIDAGAAHSLCVVSMHKKKLGITQNLLYAWGSNVCGQLSLSDKKNHLKPAPVVQFQNQQAAMLVGVACGDMFSLVRTSEGDVFACGANGYGQLGLGDLMDRADWVEVPALKEKIVRGFACGGEHTAVLTARQWVADEEVKGCMSCKNPFTLINRRHHCRNCYGIFCNSCSSKRMALLHLNITDPVRVCNACYSKLGGR